MLVVSHGRQRFRAVAATLILATALAAAGCSSSLVGGQPAVPQDSYDVGVYLCADSRSAGCSGAATDDQTNAIRDRLRSDKHVKSFVYVSLAKSYSLSQITLDAKVRRFVKPGDLPAFFEVQLADDAEADAVRADYRSMAGVTAASSCAHNPACEVRNLRQAGILP